MSTDFQSRWQMPLDKQDLTANTVLVGTYKKAEHRGVGDGALRRRGAAPPGRAADAGRRTCRRTQAARRTRRRRPGRGASHGAARRDRHAAAPEGRTTGRRRLTMDGRISAVELSILAPHRAALRRRARAAVLGRAMAALPRGRQLDGDGPCRRLAFAAPVGTARAGAAPEPEAEHGPARAADRPRRRDGTPGGERPVLGTDDDRDAPARRPCAPGGPGRGIG